MSFPSRDDNELVTMTERGESWFRFTKYEKLCFRSRNIRKGIIKRKAAFLPNKLARTQINDGNSQLIRFEFTNESKRK